jgi:hypothetical protein
MLAKISDAIKAFATFNQCTTIAMLKSNNKPALKTIQKHLAG